MKIGDEFWCYWHMKCSDIDDGKPGIACTAHLAEAHVWKCPYDDVTQGRTCQDFDDPELMRTRYERPKETK